MRLPLFLILLVSQWISAPWLTGDYNNERTAQAIEFQKEISVDRPLKSAVAHVVGLGFFEFYVNGTRVGDDVLSPNETSYSHRSSLVDCSIAMDDSNWRHFRVPYLSYDVTSLFRKGDNILGSVVGNGFYSCGTTRWVAPYGYPCFICQVELTFRDGSTATVLSDGSWQVRRSPIVRNDLFTGEVYDSRLTDVWHQAIPVKGPDGQLYPQDGPADRVVEKLSPRNITRLDDGRWEVDFGDYVTGWVRLNDFMPGANDTISIEFPIETSGNGQYCYIGNGGKVKSYAPRFSWWTFDKAIINGWPGELKPRNIVAEVVHADIRENSNFRCSNPLFNKINDIWKRTATDNMHLGVMTDCPHREKGPYTGDGQASCVTVMHNYDARQFYRKWLRDMSGCQDLETGYVPNGAPWHPGCGGGVAWGAAMCIIPWEYYLHYGDLSVLSENYVPMTEEVRYLSSWRLSDGTVLQSRKGKNGQPVYWENLGEWCPPYSLPSENLVHTWFLWRIADYTSKAADALGKPADRDYYSALADSVAAAFHRKFYNAEEGCYKSGSGLQSGQGYGTGTGDGVGDGSNIFALAMGVPENCRDRVVQSVKKELDANRGHLNTGIFGTGLFFEVLCDNGMAEEAYEAMNKRDFPSFGYMIDSGAYTMWEQWNGKDSRNHPMFGGALNWLYRRICGVMTDESAPGYRHIILRPVPCGDLTWAEYSTETSYGILSSKWKIKNGKFIYDVIIPDGCTATVYLPDGSDPIELDSGRHHLTN